MQFSANQLWNSSVTSTWVFSLTFGEKSAKLCNLCKLIRRIEARHMMQMG